MADNLIQTVGIEQLCGLLAGKGNPPITKARVSQLVKEGMPQKGRGQYDPYACMYWYIGRLRNAIRARRTENEDGSSTSVEEERKRLIRIQADAAELALKERTGELVNATEAAQKVGQLFASVKARLNAVPARAAAKVTGETNRVIVQGVIQKEINEATAELADGKFVTGGSKRKAG